jgi:adenylylsulfate kinase-like enzyme
MIAQREKRYSAAAAEFQQANQQDPRILYMESQALSGAGKSAEATKVASKAMKFNGLAFNYAYVHNKPDTTAAAAAK